MIEKNRISKEISNANMKYSEGQPARVLWWHWLSGLIFVIIFTFFAPRSKSPEYSHISEGSVSQEKIIAPFDFEIIKFPGDLENERKEASENVLPVGSKVDSIGDSFRRELLHFSSKTHKVLSGLSIEFLRGNLDSASTNIIAAKTNDSLRFLQQIDSIFNEFGFRLASETWRYLITLYLMDYDLKGPLYSNFFEELLEGVLRDLYGQGIINVPKSSVKHPTNSIVIQYNGEETYTDLNQILSPGEAREKVTQILSRMLENKAYPDGLISAAYPILQPFISSNIVFNSKETLRRRKAAIDKVPTAIGFVKKDELIIDKNIRVMKDHLIKLNSLAIVRAEIAQEASGIKVVLAVLGYGVLIGILISFYGLYLFFNRPKIWMNKKFVLLILLLLFSFHLFQIFVPILNDLSRYFLPSAVFAMLIAILIDKGTAIAGVITIALTAGVLFGNDFQSAFGVLIVGAASVMAIRRVKTRGDILRATIYLFIAFIPLIISFSFIGYSTNEKLTEHLVYAGINSVLSPILVLGLVYFFENLFGITTDLSLMELVDLNRPLLRELAIKSPGTYHHSILVGSLAEAGARSIGANALLTRAGAYYHDIGKMKNRNYFIENQETGSENIHDRLPPSKSAEILIDHVQEGLRLAEEYKLPEQIKDFIVEHHGRSTLAFFYDKAVKEMGENVDRAKFRYPGPKPHTKETGILMLADLVEAAIRTMEIKGHDEMYDVIENLFKKRLSQGDLDNCPLTLKEINLIKESFIQVGLGIHHQRVPYPDQKKVEGNDQINDSISQKP